MNPIDKLDEDRAWRDQLDPTCLDEVDGPEVVAEANHYEGALRAVLDLIDGCETAETVSEGTILSGAVKIRMGAYKRVREAITRELAGDPR